jgi:predicted DNA-binding protein with PD1-like motif
MSTVDSGDAATFEPGRAPGTNAGFGAFGRVLVVRLGPGEDVLLAMTRILERAGLRAGVILSGVASLTQLTVRTIVRLPDVPPITPADRRITTVPGPLEVLAMQGNVAWTEAGDLFIHCHLDASVGEPATNTYGGHLVDGTIVATTMELVIAEVVDLDVRRAIDPATAAPEIVVSPQLD